MALQSSFVELVKDQLSDVPDLIFKKMFGGIGIFDQGKMFGMISAENKFFLKVNDSNREDFEKMGSQPFNHAKKGKGMPYWEVPAKIFDDKVELKKWVQRSSAINFS